MFGFGIWEVILVLALVLLFFGGRKIPEVAKGLGSAIRNFKGAVQDGGGREDAEPGELPPESERPEP